ncbi:hypothetical protein BR1R5_10810 [Pseudomonas sp. BR1R-5]|uniref:hypothetical protein n=1 Tax=unclassified Pseudomonas TaxID=196821 RepID=UPI000F795466|nr:MULTISPECIES: hypothetical protein [unclassified Pseudomonas]RRV49012.1 hypothetical protein EGJ09_04175 [Pseudomonas sp. p106]GLH31695.1 hypothetical protein BR1R5_10810 [Pseudomonas sp. BR1R-5]
MKLSNLWPGHKPTVRTPARPVVSVAVTKRAGAGQPVATGNTPASICAPRGPAELPATLAECEVLEEVLCRDAIRLECQIGVAEGVAKAEKRYADPVWFHRAKAALKHINRDRQRLMVHMKALRIEARRSCPAWQARDKAILRELNARVPKEVFDECVRVVDEDLEVIR